MISPAIADLVLRCKDDLVIPASECAMVSEENSLQHALLVLSGVGHTEIPVVNKSGHITGKINMPLIINGIKTERDFLWDWLDQIKVHEVMGLDVGRVTVPLHLEEILHELCNHRFVVVENEEATFLGIITRREMLARMNFLCHQVEKYYQLTPKECAEENFILSHYPCLVNFMKRPLYDRNGAAE